MHGIATDSSYLLLFELPIGGFVSILCLEKPADMKMKSNRLLSRVGS